MASPAAFAPAPAADPDARLAAARRFGHDLARVSPGAPARGGPDLTLRAAPPAPALAAAPIQRLLRPDQFRPDTDEESEHNEHLKSVHQALGRYHAAREESEDPQDHFAAINDLHRSIYRWFDAVKRPGLHREGATPNLELMKQVLAETDEEHVGLVKRARKSGALPIDTRGMKKEEVAEARKLWTSISSQKGNLKVQGGKDFQHRQYANLARLIQGKEGRSLVGQVDRRFNYGNKTVTIGEDFAHHPALQGVQQNPGSYTLATDDKSSRILNWGRRSFTDVVGWRYFGDAKRSDQLAPQLEESVRGAKAGVWAPDKRLLRFNWGSNALLRMTQAPEGQSDLIDRDERNIANPEFVTLGHELGHALRIQRGARLDKLGGGLGGLEDLGVQDDEAKKRWTDPEEYVNITQTENPIRREHGLTERAYHVGSDVLEARRNWNLLREDHKQRDGRLDESLDDIEKHPKAKAGVKQIRSALGKLLEKRNAPHEHGLDIRNRDHHRQLDEEMAELERQGEELHRLASEDK